MDMLAAAHWMTPKPSVGHDAGRRRSGALRLAVAAALIAGGAGLFDHAARQAGSPSFAIAASETSTQHGSKP